MPRITGLIDANNLINGILQIKPNQAFLGMPATIMEFPVVNGEIEITIPATPYDVIYLVGLKSDANFKPVEQWTIPIEDCTIEEIRNISLSYFNNLKKENQYLLEKLKIVESIFQKEVDSLSLELANLKSDKSRLITENISLKTELEKLESILKKITIEKQQAILNTKTIETIQNQKLSTSEEIKRIINSV